MSERTRQRRTRSNPETEDPKTSFDTDTPEDQPSTAVQPTNLSEQVIAAYEGYANEESSGGLFGRFTKEGVWQFGADNEVPGEYEIFAVDMGTAARGWICWVNQRVQDEIMYPISSGRSVRRGELADHGPYEGGDGWNEQASFRIKSLTGNDQILIKGSSLGFRNMGARLCKDFANRIRELGGQAPLVPLVMLDGSSYPHKKFGRIAIPLMHIVDWSTHEELMEEVSPKRMRDLVTQAKALLEERRAASERGSRR